MVSLNILKTAKVGYSLPCLHLTFERMLAIIRLSNKFKREVGLIGRSMWRMCDAAKSVGYLDNNTKIASEKNLRNIRDDKFLAICTGSQGEPLGALNRIIDDTHLILVLKKMIGLFFHQDKFQAMKLVLVI